jgi:hypothetical protein
VQKLSTRPNLLQCGKLTSFVMNTGQAIADKMFGDMSQSFAIALRLLPR